MSNPTHNSTATAHSFGGMRRMFVNTTSLLTSDVINRAAVFVIYVLVGRFCGARSFGQLSLGLTLLYTFQVFASVGLPTLIIREISKRPALAGRYLANAGLIVVGAFVLSMIALAGLVWASDYPADTSQVILLLGLAILPWSLTTITEAMLRAWEKMHFLVLIHGPVNVIKVGVVYYLLSSGYNVPAVAVVFVACQFGTLLLDLPLVLRHVGLGELSPSLRFCRELMGRAWRFMGIDSLIAFWGSISAVLLSWFVGEAAVGVFAAAWQLLMPMRLTNQSIVNSLFPMLCRRAEECRTRFQQLTVLLLDLLIMLTVPISILLYFGAVPIIAFIYSAHDFASSALVMRILLPVLVLQAVTATLGQVLYSHRQEHRTLIIVVVDVLFGLVSGAALIYAFGVIGAALSQVMTAVLDACLHYFASRDYLLDDAGRSVRWKATLFGQTIVAGGIMAAALATLMQFGFVLAAVVASLLYLLVLGALICVKCRGAQTISERFVDPLKEHRDKPLVFCDSRREELLYSETAGT